MGDNTERNEPSISQDWLLARVAFEKFGVLHDFHVIQLKRYIVACCDISLGGALKINPEERTVSFDIKTEKAFVLSKSGFIERSKWSPIGLFKVPPTKYTKQKKLMIKNLTEWTRRLLWNDTKVLITVDGVPTYVGRE